MTDDQIQHMLATLSRLEAGQDRLRVMERTDRLQHETGLGRDDVTVGIGSSDHALRIAKGAFPGVGAAA